ncbi:hypothetical protein MTR67_019639 [Solanum verrucosum]|uniref:Uncharacterized protein n=1 Tax=Solanum verrucosum TaxID=315347 RepID=A0AAF0QUM5_SOLVR|nr:hypothetical protein MTR67_019639 [Solanum verrucosum]
MHSFSNNNEIQDEVSSSYSLSGSVTIHQTARTILVSQIQDKTWNIQVVNLITYFFREKWCLIHCSS